MDFSRADSRLIASRGRATSINLRFCTAQTFPHSDSYPEHTPHGDLNLERVKTLLPHLVPVTSDARSLEIAQLGSSKGIAQIAHGVMF